MKVIFYFKCYKVLTALCLFIILHLIKTESLCTRQPSKIYCGSPAMTSYWADMTASDYDRRTPLHFAASEGDLKMVKFLMQVIQPDFWQFISGMYVFL